MLKHFSCAGFSFKQFAISCLIVNCLTSFSASQTWEEVDEVSADDAVAGGQFGVSVTLRGRLGLIGANLDNESGSNSGAAYLFYESGGGTWQQLTKLTANDAEEDDLFGSSVALFGDTAFVGAIGDNGNAGSVYVFQDTGLWGQADRIAGSDLEMGDQFGYSVSLNGNTALVGAPYGDKDSIADVGAAYVFKKSGGSWLEAGKLTADDAALTEFDQFGASVALHGDIALVGAWLDSEAGSNAGAAYLFADDGQGNWSQIAKLTASDAMPDDNFGYSVSLFGDFALIGAPFGNTSSFTDVGAAYLFRHLGAGNWEEIAKLTADDAALFELDQFGTSVALGSGTALVGAPFDLDAGFGAGAAYVFSYDSGNWNQIEKLTASNAAEFDQFGWAVAVSGNRALIGAIGTNGTGAAYVFSDEELYLPADFNEDHVVDSVDLEYWLTGYGTQAYAVHSDGDADDDGDIDGIDFLIWQRQFGTQLIALVPEPHTLMLSLILLISTAWKRRSRLC